MTWEKSHGAQQAHQRWRKLTEAFPSIRTGKIYRLAAKFSEGSAEWLEGQAILAMRDGDVDRLSESVDALRRRGDMSSLAHKIVAYLHLDRGRTQQAMSHFMEAGDPSLAADIEVWRKSADLFMAFPPRHTFSIVSALRDEAEYLEEWIAYHTLLGCEHFYLYENHSRDGTAELIQGLAKSYPITFYSFAKQPAQALAYNHFLRVHGSETAWAALIDGDEYLRPLEGYDDIRGLLQVFNDRVAAVALNWIVFGSSNYETKPDGLNIEAFHQRQAAPSAIIKSIVRPSRVVRLCNPHVALVVGRYVTSDGVCCFPLRDEVRARRQVQPLSVAHFIVRSKEQFTRKRARGRPYAEMPLRDLDYFRDHDINEISDPTLRVRSDLVRLMIGTRGSDEKGGALSFGVGSAQEPENETCLA